MDQPRKSVQKPPCCSIVRVDFGVIVNFTFVDKNDLHNGSISD